MTARNPDRQEVLFRVAYRYLTHRHNKRWSAEPCIGLQTFKELVVQPCVYCGFEASNEVRDRRSRLVLRINGVDRIDNTKGYVEGNVAPSCRYCNAAKNDRKLKYFLHWIAEVYHKSVKGTANDLDISE